VEKATFFILQFHHLPEGGSLMKKIQDFVLKGKEVYVGLKPTSPAIGFSLLLLHLCDRGLGLGPKF
jgi:hypothetical protein